MIKQKTIILKGAVLEGLDPHPRFKAKNPDMSLFHDGTLYKEDLERYGKDCTERTLPYQMQDRYSRAEDKQSLNAIIMENEYLKAVFLPQFGGKLWSLYSKDEKRELLFENSLLRPANLANRNAWTAGGIEWNQGHTGHCAFTCDDIFCAIVTAEDGEEFLRIYEYEASHAQVMQMDFHLPNGAKQLGMFVRIENARDEESPLYWWTNTAVRLTPDTRVFSQTPEIIYQLTPDPKDNIPGFGVCKMPVQPNLQCDDISYPWRIPHSVEYFFRNKDSYLAPWEVCIEKDCKGFFERSTQPLFSRKMFCWGSSIGGKHWCDYLSREGEGDYIEIQAGLAPTQNHTSVLAAGGVLTFTQMFGAFTAPDCAQTAEWNEARGEVEKRIEETLSMEDMEFHHQNYLSKAELPAKETVYRGNIYGQLENTRRKKQGKPPVSPHLDFAAKNNDADVWLDVLEGNPIPNTGRRPVFVTDSLWEGYLEHIGEKNEISSYYYAVLLAENNKEGEAVVILEELSKKGDCYASYTLGLLSTGNCRLTQASYYHGLALKQAGTDADESFSRGAIAACLAEKEYEKAWDIFAQIPKGRVTQSQILLACEAAVKLENWEFLEPVFEMDITSIREGSTGLADIWLEYKSRKKAKEEGIPFSDDRIDRSILLPQKLNFRMFD